MQSLLVSFLFFVVKGHIKYVYCLSIKYFKKIEKRKEGDGRGETIPATMRMIIIIVIHCNTKYVTKYFLWDEKLRLGTRIS